MIDKNTNGAPFSSDSASPQTRSSNVYGHVDRWTGSPRSSLDIDDIDLLARGVIASSPFCVLAVVGARGVESWPLAGPLGFIKVLSPRMIVAPYPLGLGGLKRPARDAQVGLTVFVPGMDACLHVRGRAADPNDPGAAARGHARIGPARTSFMIAVESASLCPGPVVLLPNSGAGVEMLADALPRFDELVVRPNLASSASP